jgi:hypothetical protein
VSSGLKQVRGPKLISVGAGAVLLLVTCLTTPTRSNSYLTRVQGVNENGVFNLNLGILGGCNGDFLKAYVHHVRYGSDADRRRTIGNGRDLDCDTTYGNGYRSTLLLPPLAASLVDDLERPYPYGLNFSYRVVTYGMTRGLVMVPIATALGFIAAILFIFASHKLRAGLDWVSSVVIQRNKRLTV